MPRPGAMQKEILSTVLKRKTVTIRYPFEPPVRPEGLRGKISYDITKCTGCGLCARDCPATAITMVESKVTKTKKKPEFRLDRCIFCGTCEAVCPTKAIKLTTDFELATFDKETLFIRTPDPETAEKSEN